jgi:ACS family tartrate transporter-like MFS transporter
VTKPSTSEIESRTIRKITVRMLPLIGVCYIVLYLDRMNISVAALTMNQELGITAAAFGLAAGIFFWTYTIFEVPSNYILGKVGTRVWITRIMITWGLVTLGTAFVHNATSLSIARLLLGIAEAGFSPAMLFFAACWFPKRQRGMAMALMFSAICVSAVLTPLLTHILTWTDGLAGLSGWRWLFILTGIPPLILGAIWYRLVRDTPAQATFLTETEKTWLTKTLAEEDSDLESHSAGNKTSFVSGLLNWRIAVLTIIFLCFTFSLYGYQFWIPQIVKNFGVTNNQVGWISAIPPLLAIGPMLWWARHSDRTQERVGHFCIAALVASGGFAIAALFLDRPVIAMIGFSLAGIGLYSAMATLMVIPSSFLKGAALAAGLAFINGTGNFGGYLGPQITGLIKEATNSFTLAAAVFAITMLTAALIAFAFKLSTKPAPVTPDNTNLEARSPSTMAE